MSESIAGHCINKKPSCGMYESPVTLQSMIKLSSSHIETMFQRFSLANPEPSTELISKNEYTLLVAVMLSAQMTDKGVNKATEALFAVVDTPEKMIALGEEGLRTYIKTINLYPTKARNIIATSKKLIEEFNSHLPLTREGLQSLPGVGRKTANVILNVVYGEAVMPVDTHLLRLAPRVGLSDKKTPEEVERDLLLCIPKNYLKHAHHWLLLHGRYVCVARKPHCDVCCIEDLCPKNGVVVTP